MGKWLPLEVKARDDSLPVHSDTAATSGDPSIVSSSIRPMSGTVTRTTGGADRAAPLGTSAVASDCVSPVTAAAISTYVSRTSTGGVVPAAVGATSVSGSSVRPDVGSRITSLASYLASSEGVPSAPASACPIEGVGATAGGA